MKNSGSGSWGPQGETPSSKNNRKGGKPAGSDPTPKGKNWAAGVSDSAGYNTAAGMRSHAAHPGKTKV